MTGLTIPFFGLKRQYKILRDEILDATDSVLRTGNLMDGSHTQEFQDWIGNKNSVPYVVLCHSGTQALEIIASYAEIATGLYKSHITVGIPSVTYRATANAFRKNCWNLNFIEIDRYGQAITKKLPEITALVRVGLYGAALESEPDFDGIIIEDAAQHWLADNCKRRSKFCAISFDPTKNLGNYGNGGAVLTTQADFYQYALDYTHNIGKDSTNSRMSEVDCAQLMVKTRYLNGWQARRKQIAAFWMDKFRNTPVESLVTPSNINTHCFQKFVIKYPQRNQLREYLSIRHIETKIHYEEPLFELPAYKNFPAPTVMSAASAFCRHVLSLPMYPELTDSEVEYIADNVIAGATGKNG